MPGGMNKNLKDAPWVSAASSLNYLDGKLYHCGGGAVAGKCFEGTFQKPTKGNNLTRSFLQGRFRPTN